MEHEINSKAYKLGILFQIYYRQLINLSASADLRETAGLNDTESLLNDIFQSIDVSISLPNVSSKDEILNFFQHDFENLLMMIGNKLYVMYDKKAADIFHFSFSASGYLQSFGKNEIPVKQLNAIILSLNKQAETFDIEQKYMAAFFENPRSEWDMLTSKLLPQSNESLTDVVSIKPGVAGISFDLKKAASIITRWINEHRS